MLNSSMRIDAYSNWAINHKESFIEELVRSFVETEDEVAFNEIVNFYADKIYMLALRITRNLRDADEVLQEVFLTMENLNTFPVESNFSNWFHRVVENTSYKHLRAKKKYEKEVILEDQVSYNESGKSGALEGVQIKYGSHIPDEILLSRKEMEMIEMAVLFFF